MLKLILADNLAIFRAGIAKVLAVEDEMRIVAQAQTPEQMFMALDKFRAAVLIVAGGFHSDFNGVLQSANRNKTRVVVLAASADQAPFQPGRRRAATLRAAGEMVLLAPETGSKSASVCCACAWPTNTRSPSGNMTMSPRRKVLSAKRVGTGLAISPGGFGFSGGLASGCSARTVLGRRSMR